MARRSYGTGSISIRHGNYYGRWRVGGRLVQRKLGPVRQPGSRDGLTRAQAERAMRRRMEQGHAVAATAARLSVAEAGERLIDHLEALGRKRSTLEGYRSALRVHLGPFFGEKPLDRIAREDVERFIGRRARAGSSPKSVQNYLGVLHGIFDFAGKRGWAATNPVKLVERPRKSESREVRFLTISEVEALLRAVPDDDLGRVERVMYLAAATTGMRQGELVGLRWRDVDWSASRIRVRRNYVRGEFGTPQSKRSSRAVPMIDRLAGELDRLSR